MMDNYIIGMPDLQVDDWEQQMAPDNCAVVAQMSLINQFLENPISQEEATYVAATNGWYIEGVGTMTSDVGNLMDAYGVSTHQVSHASLGDLASELQSGHGVIVGVNSGQLWDEGPLNDLYQFIMRSLGLDTSEFNPADHAVVVTGIDASDPENPMVILNDSGTSDGQGVHYPLDKFMDAWENSDFHMTATDMSIPSGGGGEDIDFSQWIPTIAGVAAGGATFATIGDMEASISVGCSAYHAFETLMNDESFMRTV